jgi:TetR/AcrR family transcriptional repressor of nem operon
VVHERGFGGASVRDIVQAAGVPQGSFTNHFASKEAFGLEVIELYYEQARQMMAATLEDRSRSPLERLRAYVDASGCRAGTAARAGCLLGNFTMEAANSEAIRTRLAEIFAETRVVIAECLSEGMAAGEIDPTLDAEEVAGFIVASLQGATALGKVEIGAAPIDRFKHVLFGQVLRPAATG